jgi:hypothetical protein
LPVNGSYRKLSHFHCKIAITLKQTHIGDLLNAKSGAACLARQRKPVDHRRGVGFCAVHTEVQTVRIRMILVFLALIASCLASAFAQGVASTSTKTLFIPGLPLANDPVRIKAMDGTTELKSDGRPLPNHYSWETAFDAGDDWITNLSFVIKNVSAKKITCIVIFSVLTEAPFWREEIQPKPPAAGFTLNQVGQKPEQALHSGDRTFPPDTEASFELAPGEEFTMPIEDPRDYSALRERIEERLPISSVTDIDGQAVTVFFEDGTRWVSLNHSYSRPAEQPGEWTKLSYEEWAGKQKSSEQ